MTILIFKNLPTFLFLVILSCYWSVEVLAFLTCSRVNADSTDFQTLAKVILFQIVGGQFYQVRNLCKVICIQLFLEFRPSSDFDLKNWT